MGSTAEEKHAPAVKDAEIRSTKAKTRGSRPRKGTNMSEKTKVALYLSAEQKAELERRYTEDGSRSQTEFAEHALAFYLDYLSAKNAGAFLPAAVSSVMEGRLGQKSTSRNELVQEARAALRELVTWMGQGICDHPEAERRMHALSSELASLGGKKTYGYLPKRLKKQVDEIVDGMERLPSVAEAYDRWLELQRLMDGYYKDEERPRRKLSEEKEFRAIKNAVIREAELIQLGTPTFEDEEMDQEDAESESFADMGEDWVLVLEELAEQGNAVAQYRLGLLYRDGPTPIPDWLEARYYLEQAARQGLMDAQYAWAGCFSRRTLRCGTRSWGCSGWSMRRRKDIPTPHTGWGRNICVARRWRRTRKRHGSTSGWQPAWAISTASIYWGSCVWRRAI